MICDKSAPSDNPPESTLVEAPGCTYTVTWRHPSACGATEAPSECQATAPPAPPVQPCELCHPKWKPTWDMMRSTVLYTCNNSGFHNVDHAVKFGLVVYDWSNAKALWANTKPMDDQERLNIQAEIPGVSLPLMSKTPGTSF